MKPHLLASLTLAGALALPLGAAHAAQAEAGQPAAVTSSQPVPDTAAPSPGIPSDQAVNPAPGAHGPYVGAGPNAFYDVDARITRVQGRADSLPASARRKVMAAIRGIKAEERTQIARHGTLRDWDRENINYKLDQLVATYPSLGPSSGAPAPSAEPGA